MNRDKCSFGNGTIYPCSETAKIFGLTVSVENSVPGLFFGDYQLKFCPCCGEQLTENIADTTHTTKELKAQDMSKDLYKQIAEAYRQICHDLLDVMKWQNK